jgi:hypothetical protein
MLILDLTAVCGSYAVATLLSVFKRALNLIQMIGPIVGIIALIINFTKLMIIPDEKKLKNVIRNWAIAIIMLFLIPTCVNLVMRLFDDTFTVSKCWNQVDELFDSGVIYNTLENSIDLGNGEYSLIIKK